MAIPTLIDSFTADLNLITLTEQSAELVFQLTDTVTADVILLEKYTPDASGTITLYDIGKTLELYLQTPTAASAVLTPHANTQRSFTFSFGASSQQILVAFCPAEIGLSYAEFKDNFFCSALTAPKRTRLDSVEELYWYAESAISVKLVTMQQDNLSGEITQSVIYISFPDYSSGKLRYKNVSPALFVIEGKTLIKYQIQVENRVKEYVIDYNSYFNIQHFVFTNNFGVPETLYFVGENESESKTERSFAHLAAGSYVSNAIFPKIEYTLDTGVLTQDEANWLLDFFYSQQIAQYTATTIGKAITILEDTITRSSNPSELPRFSFKYRISQDNNRILPITIQPRIFDLKFTKPFE